MKSGVRSNLDATWITVLLLFGLAFSPSVFAADQFQPGAVWLDNHGLPINAHGGGILRHDGIYYWFGEHKIQGTAGNEAHVGVHVYSSRDLYHWRDEGIALKVSTDSKSDIVDGCILERPKVIYCQKTGKFVMWFHLELKGQGYKAARTGVAIADQPTGPYQFLDSFRPNAGFWPSNVRADEKRPLTTLENEFLSHFPMTGGPVPGFPANLVFRRDFVGGQMSRDMTLFVDDNGSAYQIYSSEENSTLQISQLSDDFLKPSGRYVRVFPGGFNEAPAIFKHEGKYFLITSGCTGWQPNAARLAVADSIWGPWTPLGNPCVGANAGNTFESQSTFVFHAEGNHAQLVFMADRWRPENAIDGRYVWLPIQFQDGRPTISWMDHWSLERN